ncbi:hypothetical protein B0A52_07225 [Exophiala mesophila]|uniref:Tubulin-specific chaperone A n=1 Tax=Exophiala mesophila TaxID=212818 RepID=A0A0D2A9F2_EXOME|nr:uncharacterized protein PV10_03214 [Exophiala mesophila]KIV95578.1 hypothetical protein PV10_03214 [Exophiala mesophila]RVX69249.1 hypothetical protein B0A52_07225 [Exophiala mesophila]
MAPSQIQIATSSLQRLLKEEASYYKEQEQQEARIQKLEKQDPATSADSDGNQAFLLKQERRALDETKAVIPALRERITSAREKLESLLDTASTDEERNTAFDVLKAAKEAQKDDPIAGQ